MKAICAFFHVCCFFAASAQYQVGHTTITFNDPLRTGGFGSGGGTGRQIQTEIYYPSNIAGDDVAVANGEFPVITFGHGFAMGWDSYANIWEHYVNLGFILALPRTEGGTIAPPPKHFQFALDLKLVNEKMLGLNGNPISIFYNKIYPKTAIMGHSMGGGAAILAASNNSLVTTVIGLAPAETNDTSAITKAKSVTIPAIIFSGSGDAATPPLNHHLPIYSNLSSLQKSYVSILGGGHCYFANNNALCNLGEGSSNITITRQEQQDKMYAILDPWLDFVLKQNCGSYKMFVNSINGSNGTQNQTTCSSNALATIEELNSLLTVSTTGNPTSFQWFLNGTPILGATNQTYNAVYNGNYTVEVTFDFDCEISGSYLFNNGVASISIENCNFNIYPNPVNSELTIYFKSVGRKEIKLIDINGRVVYNELIDAIYSNVNCELLDLGSYLIEIKQDGLTKRIKFLKQ